MRIGQALPPIWLAAGALALPAFLVIGVFAVTRLADQRADHIALPLQVITATAPPGLDLPAPFVQALSQTPPPAPTPSPTANVPSGFAPQFVTVTPAFSLATSSIVFTCYVNGSDEICLMRADGSNLQQLTDEQGTDWYPAFSPDGTEIVFSSQRGGQFNIYAMGRDDGNLRRLTSNLGNSFAPSLSPDGTQVVFASDSGDVQNIWVVGYQGGTPVRLTNGSSDAIDPVWSPDGRMISFTSNASGTGDLMIMNADGTNIRQVTHGINVEGRNDWSPDGRYLVFYAGPAADKDIYLVEVACASVARGCGPGQMLKLTEGGNNKAPSFSPDGEWITFASQLDGDNEIFVMRIDGSEIYQLTSNQRADWQPRWGG